MKLNLMVNNMPVQAEYDDDNIEEVFLPLLHTLNELQKKKGGRILVFLAAPPAAGKSSLSKTLAKLAETIPGMEKITVIGMDGFHRYQKYLTTHTTMRDGIKIPMVKVKGSPVTFDLPKMRENLKLVKSGANCFWPDYDRMNKDPVENGLKVDSDIVLMEGNYLLLDQDGWRDLKNLADYTIRITAEPEFLRNRLIKRKKATGVTLEEAVDFVDFSDMVNVKTCLEHTGKADLNLYLDPDGIYHTINTR